MRDRYCGALNTYRWEGCKALLLGTALALSSPGLAQTTEAEAVEPTATQLDVLEVTGTRIRRQDYVANSPTITLSEEQVVRNADITVDTFLNTLPQVNPAGTITSNNPGNGGQASIDLRGLGANRNLVLIDGRRPMVSAPDQTVDLNTIPQGMIERIEIITGAAGAVYGADAVAGVVNVITKRDFQGFDLRLLKSNHIDKSDAEENQVTGVLGGNFDNGRGNMFFAFDYAFREAMIKSQRDFAAVATATTTFLPEGLYFVGGNAPTQAAVDAVFAGYGVAAGAVPANSNLIGFNLDGTLFSRGIFNSPIDVQNWRYPVDSSVNTNLFPDVYSYNFDAVNILRLPLERRSLVSKARYQLNNDIEVFGQAMWSEYTALTALAPTPIPTVRTAAPGTAGPTNVVSSLVEPGRQISSLLVIPVTNPFIPADFQSLLNSRTGDNLSLVGSGATEPFLMRQRTLDAGLRSSLYENTVVQGLFGATGPIAGDWRWEAYASEGRTEIDQIQSGNIDTQRLQTLLEAPDGGASICAGGFNPFGRQPISPACVNYLEVQTTLSTAFTQQVVQAFVSGSVASLPAGLVSAVLGAENRYFSYEFDPGSAGGPISGFNTQDRAGGRNNFKDVFGELAIPLLNDPAWGAPLELGVAARHSRSQFVDEVGAARSRASGDMAYKLDLSWGPRDYLRLRTAFQHAVRAPNFGELFDGGSSAPQYFDPCSVTSTARTDGVDDAALRDLCAATGLGAGVDNYVQTPGTQIQIILTGNTALQPESADTFTLGAVFGSPQGTGPLGGLQGSIDYYQIKISDPILVPNPNLIVADCYNYFGSNPTYDVAHPNCQALVRFGGDILFIDYPNDAEAFSSFPGINAGEVVVSGIDMALDYGLALADIIGGDAAGTLGFNLRVNHVLTAEQQERPELPKIDYAGTVSFFGEGLGQSFPEWRANLNSRYSIASVSFDLRTRYIHGMENRASRLFPNEQSFSGVGSVTYWDLITSWQATSSLMLRAGVNNLFDKQPPTYRPNVQSGTDPSLYDVVGRRWLAQVELTFF